MLTSMRRIHGASSACMAMCGSGAATGMAMATTSAVQRMIHVGRLTGRTVCCAAAAGTALRRSVAPRSASGIFLLSAAANTTAASAFVAPKSDK